MTDKNEILSFMQKFSFATIVSTKEEIPIATHLPFLIQQIGEDVVLTSHFAKENDHWQHIEKGIALVVFQEPHAYISPTHYEKDQSGLYANQCQHGVTNIFSSCRLYNILIAYQSFFPILQAKLLLMRHLSLLSLLTILVLPFAANSQSLDPKEEKLKSDIIKIEANLAELYAKKAELTKESDERNKEQESAEKKVKDIKEDSQESTQELKEQSEKLQAGDSGAAKKAKKAADRVSEDAVDLDKAIAKLEKAQKKADKSKGKLDDLEGKIKKQENQKDKLNKKLEKLQAN